MEASEDRLKTLFNQAADAVFLLGEAGFIDCNQAAVDLLRYSSKTEILALQPHHISPERHPDWANTLIVNEALPMAIEQGSWSGELALLDGNGNEIPVSQMIIAHKSDGGEVENFSTIMRDVRDRKRTEIALQLSEARDHAGFDQAAQGIVESDMQTGTLIRVNKYYCELVGYTDQELQQMSVADLTHPDDIPASQQLIQDLFTRPLLYTYIPGDASLMYLSNLS